ncbi:hypothetical protein A2215_02275 [Candidatus Berkelbacteria bacterium RIFOXYA2_FULL_43_10]|uniref:DUF4134 domain-containing protein n=1 Tax=Candidatus Berkelbacteria bacterium RIFOXYA2_FULL_43_10 TaxID=1797472 RepID=A0A1F5E3I2_9BACT|nr:MAG: hypothetical protein A2215_02275 [Candidatus Berkelbacteria bacterium RIFOXYA2_FULL_43_10]
MLKYFKYILTSIIVLLPSTALAVKTGIGVPTGENDADGKPILKTDFTDYVGYMGAIFSFAMKAGAVLTTLMIIYAGYKYLTSQGNPTALGEAKDIIIGSLSGFAMLLLIYLILTVLQLPPAVVPQGTT